MSEKMKLRGPDGKDYEVAEGQALGVMEERDADGKPICKVVDIVEHEGAERVVDDQYLRALGDLTTEIKENRVALENRDKAMKDIEAARSKMRLRDPSSEPWVDSEDLSTLDEILEHPASSEWARQFHRMSDRVLVEKLKEQGLRMVGRPAKPFQESRAYKRLSRFLEQTKGIRIEKGEGGERAATYRPETTGAAGEWAPTGVSRTTIDLHRLQTGMVNSIPSIEVPRGMQILTIPAIADALQVDIVASASGTSSHTGAGLTVDNPATGVLTLTPVKQGSDVMAWSMEQEEDGAVVIGQVLSREAMYAMAKARESGIINGQPAGAAGMDGNDHETVFPITGRPSNGYDKGGSALGAGLRYYGLVTNANTATGGGSALTIDDFIAALQAMGNFGIGNPANDVNCALDQAAWWDFIGDSTVRAVNTAGPRATLPEGALTQLFNCNVYVTDQIPLSNATGKVEATGNTLGSSVFYNSRRWRRGESRGMELVVQESPLDDAVNMRAFARHCIAMAPPFTDDHVCVLINYPQ